MGYYIDVPNRKGKAQQIVDLHGGRILPHAPIWGDAGADEAIICVLDNGPWEAAGFAYNERELERFAEPDLYTQQRPRIWLVMNRTKACKLTGYKEYK